MPFNPRCLATAIGSMPHEETTESLIKKLEDGVENLASKGIDKDLIWGKCLLTPSYDTGTRSIEISDQVYHRLSEMSKRLRH